VDEIEQIRRAYYCAKQSVEKRPTLVACVTSRSSQKGHLHWSLKRLTSRGWRRGAMTCYLLDTDAPIHFSKGRDPAFSQVLHWIDTADILAGCAVSVAEYSAGLKGCHSLRKRGARDCRLKSRGVEL
jgi:hypothetical protein